MSDAQHPVETFDIYEVDDDDDADEMLIGHAEYGSDGTLRLTGGDPERTDYLQGVLARVNAKPEISLKAPPAAEDADDRFALGAVTVARGEDGFLDALQTYLMTYYGLRLG